MKIQKLWIIFTFFFALYQSELIKYWNYIDISHLMQAFQKHQDWLVITESSCLSLYQMMGSDFVRYFWFSITLMYNEITSSDDFLFNVLVSLVVELLTLSSIVLFQDSIFGYFIDSISPSFVIYKTTRFYSNILVSLKSVNILIINEYFNQSIE